MSLVPKDSGRPKQLFAPVLRVTFPETDADFGPGLADSLARRDDADWAWLVAQPYTPQRFLNWWVARRWVVPRDVRRR